MSKLSVLVTPNGAAPEPELPEGLADPCIGPEICAAGEPWVWDGKNVSLVRHPSLKLISEQIAQLRLLYEAGAFRSLQATELQQLKNYSDRWPEEWRRHRDGRIFFAGTIYPVAYPGDLDHNFVWAAWFDAEMSAWDFGCFSADTMLRPHDEFACLALAQSKIVEAASQRSRIPPPRRDREPTIPRERLGLIR